ncbi:MAG: glucose-6-phosphate dehydrogenase [Xanthobacteraceae bacterium]
MTGKTATTSARPADPCTLIIFGASGDLTHRLLLPALYNLAVSGLLPEAFALIGVARSESTSEAFRDDLAKSLPKFATRDIDERVVKRLLASVAYVQGEPDDETTYQKLGKELSRIESGRATKGNRLFYLATPPAAFTPIGCHLGQSGLAREENGAWRRVVIEKPFGTDLASARDLNQKLLSVLKEDQIFRIDHYLGKETVQNIMVLRFANGLFEPIWNRHHIEHVQITVAESLTVGRRGNYYDATGALRDMVPNHLIQLLSLIAMEPPSRFAADAVRAEKAQVLKTLREDQIYRIDHFLGKETVQNIMALRFANGLFEPIWNRHHIEHVQITVAESLTVERRGSYYDATGALRDMVPNHLCQLLSLIAMEPPSRFAADAVRAEKAQVLDAVQYQMNGDALRNSVRAQYGDGYIDNRAVEAYRKTKDVKPDSITETYVALKLMIDNWRWAGVPFYLRTGKALRAKQTEVAIKFRQAPVAMFRETPIDRLAENFLVIRIQPDECIGLEFNAKIPGPSIAIGGVGMTFKYGDYFEASPSTGYETLIYDCMIGDAILYPRADGIEAGWRIVQPFLDAWRDAGADGLATYRAGSEGPSEADELLARDGRRWRPIV